MSRAYQAITTGTWRKFLPSLMLVIFVALALVRTMPGGYGRGAIAIPIAVLVPGALTLMVLVGRRRIDSVAFSVLAALLGVLWSAFASLMLYVAHVLITA